MQTTRAPANPLFSVSFCGREYQVDHVLHKRPIAIVLAVSRNSQRYVIKVVSIDLSIRQRHTHNHIHCSIQNAKSPNIMELVTLTNAAHTKYSDHPIVRLFLRISAALRPSRHHIPTKL